MARLTVRVVPRSGGESVSMEAGTILIRVRAAPDKGAANEASARVLAAALGVPRSSVHLLRGARSRIKIVDVEGLDSDEAFKRLKGP